MAIKEFGTRQYSSPGEQVVTLRVPGNVPKNFEGGTVTELTFSREQAAEIFYDLSLVIGATEVGWDQPLSPPDRHDGDTSDVSDG